MRKGFTLVELIIVITILVILSTIAFLNFGNYGSQARDTVRISDFKNIEKALELYKIENGRYPEPDELSEEEKQKTQGEKKFVGFTEGKIGENLSAKLKFGQTPKDPSDKSYYRYSVSEDGKIYLMKLELETNEQKIVGDIPINCKTLKEKNNFKGNGVYTVFHENIEPREVYCHQNYEETFQLGVIGGDMEKILGNNENNQKYATFYEGSFQLNTKTEFTTEEAHSGERSLKVTGRGDFVRSGYIYIDPSKSYKVSGWFKIKRKDPNINLKADVVVILWRNSYIDGTIKLVPLGQYVTYKGTETILTKDLKSNDKIMEFECDENIYNSRKKNLDLFNSVAFNIKEDFSDLPNKNLSPMIGRWNDARNVTGFVKVKNNETWGQNKNEKKVCTLNSHNNFGVNYPAGTKIRKHHSGGNNYNAIHNGKDNAIFDEWIYLEGKLDAKDLTKFDNFLKLGMYLNYKEQYKNGAVVNTLNENTITYVDDFKFEVIN